MTDADPLADLEDRTPLYDDNGRLLVVFSLGTDTRDDRPWADAAWRPVSAPVEATCRVIREALAGYAFSTADVALVAALLDAGATQIRHAHSMSHTLRAVPDSVASSTIRVESLSAAQLARHVQRLAEVNFAAYPVGHPDHAQETIEAVVDELLQIGRGELLGRYLDSSQVAVVDGVIGGACLVVNRTGVPPNGGSWIIDIFRDPGSTTRGIGTALLIAALNATKEAGAPGLSLAVSHTNERARRLYAGVGFDDAEENWTLALPS